MRLFALMAMTFVVDAVTGRLTGMAGTSSFWVVGAIRLVSSLAILRYPLAGFVLALELDKWDWYWLGMADRPDEVAFYQQWDKAIDLLGFIPAAVVVWRWKDDRVRMLAGGALALRVLGVLAFFATGQRWLLIAFPNVFESIFLLYIVFRIVTARDELLDGMRSTVLVALALIVPKVAQEYFLHALGERPWDIMQLTASRVVDVWIWAGVLYALPLIALVILVVTSEGRVRRSDPEVQWSR